MATEGIAPAHKLPEWAQEIVRLYESDSASQFIVYGNVFDQLITPAYNGQRLGSLTEFLMHVLLSSFQVVISYDIGNGIRVEKGGEIFSKWPHFQQSSELPKTPRAAVEYLTSYFRYVANLARLAPDASVQIACIIRNANLLAPMVPGALDYDLSALASLMRDWASETLLTTHSLATFLIVENLNDLHSLIANNPRAARCKVALPSEPELRAALAVMAPQYTHALAQFKADIGAVAGQLAGATVSAVESMLKIKEHTEQEIVPDDLVRMKKQLVEQDCNGLIEFIQSARTLDDLYGVEKVKAWLRQDIALWQENDLQAIPKGYLLCGPVGTGKTFVVECLAGEAGVPVVKLKNFRDKWVGSTEGNLEKIFRLLQAMGRAYVFIDEADQAIGRRQASDGDSGISGRIYSMLAEEMGSSANRGKLIWVLASSRPDLIEVDLKRPGRVDVKIPLFPTVDTRESFELLRTLCKRRGIELGEESFAAVQTSLPLLLTPGAAETLAVKLYRSVRTQNCTPMVALQCALVDYQNPVPLETLQFQIDLAMREASDLEFVPLIFRKLPSAKVPPL
jgi:hypothetical protein